jgi:hypothetical protein
MASDDLDLKQLEPPCLGQTDCRSNKRKNLSNAAHSPVTSVLAAERF